MVNSGIFPTRKKSVGNKFSKCGFCLNRVNYGICFHTNIVFLKASGSLKGSTPQFTVKTSIVSENGFL